MKPIDFCILLVIILSAVSCSKQDQKDDWENIVLVNADTLSRKGIAEEIAVINGLNPKVIAIDFQFSNNSNYSYDLQLMVTFSLCKNLVMVSLIEDYTRDKTEYEGFKYGSLPQFLLDAKTGFVDYMPDNDKMEAWKDFHVKEKVNIGIEYHFGVRVAMTYDSLKAVRFVELNPRVVDVDYKEGKRKFKMFSSSQVLNKKITQEDVEGKIVMIGFLGPGNEDKFFTPLGTNPKEPDMYGLEYLANIVAQVLEN